ncbi:hypothetical protein FBUS_07299 [Fasciolopsis buskii]|uniref:Uncharacterized protein n=1 Tax=Fasciolopsis buskii TaxID=27845 RepID=A0A8E0S3M4_9TREM|nr:hypothetical protein FBUS_07299 [Fasciolopsis buski]
MIAKALPNGPNEHLPGERPRIESISPKPVAFSNDQPHGPMPPLRHGRPDGPESALPGPIGPGPINVPLRSDPERPPDAVASSAGGPERPTSIDFPHGHPESPPGPPPEGMGPPVGPLFPPPASPMGPIGPPEANQEPGNTPIIGPNIPSHDESILSDRSNKAKMLTQDNRDSEGLFNSLHKPPELKKSVSRPKSTKSDSGSLLDQIVKKFSSQEQKKKSTTGQKKKKSSSKGLGTSKKSFPIHHDRMLFNKNAFDSPRFGPTMGGPHELYGRPMPPPHMVVGHHPPEPLGPLVMMNPFGEPGLPHPVAFSEGRWNEERGFLPPDREFGPFLMSDDPSRDLRGPNLNELVMYEPSGIPDPITEFQSPGAPLLGPEGLEPVKQTLNTAENQTLIKASLTENGTEAESDATSSYSSSESTTEANESKAPLTQKLVRGVSSEKNSKINMGTPYQHLYADRPYYYLDSTAPKFTNPSQEDLIAQIRLLENEVRYWQMQYKYCQNYRSKIRSALNEEIKRAKNAGFSVQQVSMTGLSVLFVADWLHRWY